MTLCISRMQILLLYTIIQAWLYLIETVGIILNNKVPFNFIGLG